MRKILVTFMATLFLSGCVARTYQLTKERLDQDLSSGNRGYLRGTPDEAPLQRKSERTVRVFEVEFGKPYPAKEVVIPASSPIVSTIDEQKETAEFEEAVYSTPLSVPLSQKIYKVEKGDTLQKISQKFYGTTKKWYKIYQANKETLKTPDKLYPGQVLNIPELPKEQSEDKGSLKVK